MMHQQHQSQSGSALVYILIAIALLGALTATLMNSSSSPQTTSQRTAETYAALKSQIDLIRSVITECVQIYPSGDNALANNPALAQIPGTLPYPLMPRDTYLASPTAGSMVRDLRCPGNPGNSNNHAKMFGGTSGKYLRPVPAPFIDWYYENVADGVFFLTRTTASDPFVKPALDKLDAAYAKCEADVIDARSATKTITTTSGQCPSGSLCFRVWILAKPSALYPDEAGCPGS